MGYHYPVPLPHALPPVYLQSVARPAAAVRMSLSAELMFPVRMFLPVAPVFPTAGPLFPMPAAPSVAPGPLFPMPAAPSVAPGLSFPVQKSLADWFLVPVSVATPFLESESQAQVFLWSDSLSSLSPVQQD